jgi:hypothetical protein
MISPIYPPPPPLIFLAFTGNCSDKQPQKIKRYSTHFRTIFRRRLHNGAFSIRLQFTSIYPEFKPDGRPSNVVRMLFEPGFFIVTHL